MRNTDRVGHRAFHYSDAEFLDFEKWLKNSRYLNDEIWRFRVTLFLILTVPKGKETRRRFNHGIIGALAAHFRDWLRAKPDRQLIPQSEYLFLIYGNFSKEYDTLMPIAQELNKNGHSVTVLWLADTQIASDVLQNWKDIQPIIIEYTSIWADKKYFSFTIWLNSIRFLLHTALILRKWPGALRTIWQQRTRIASRYVAIKLIEEFLNARFACMTLAGIGFASDTSEPGEALVRIAKQKGCPSHHFLHGLANLVHTRSLADHVYCFSGPEREFFIENGWDPEHVHSGCYPRQDVIAAKVRDCRRQLPVQNGLKVLFANQGVEGAYDEWHHLQTLHTVCRAVTELKLGEDQFRIRFHPILDPSSDLMICDKYAISRDSVSKGSIYDDLAWANVVITPHSTVGIEAIYAGCYVIWIAVGTFHFPMRERLIASGYGRKVSNTQQLIDVLSECCNYETYTILTEELVMNAHKLEILNSSASSNAACHMLQTVSLRKT